MATIEITAVGDGAFTARYYGAQTSVVIDGVMLDSNGQSWSHQGPIDVTEYLTQADLDQLAAWDVRRREVLLQVFEDQQAQIASDAAARKARA